MKEKINWVVICVAIIALAVIEIVALCKGINGTLMSAMMGAIVGLVMWNVPTPKQIVRG